MNVKNDVRIVQSVQLAVMEQLLDIEELERRQAPDIDVITVGPTL